MEQLSYMNKRLLGYVALALLLLSVMSFGPYRFAKSADASAPAVQWTKTYAGAAGSSVIQTDDQGFLIVSSPQISSPDTELELIKTDSLGNQIWLRTYPGFPGSVMAIQTDDGGYVIGGTTVLLGRNQFFLAKLDVTGTTLWNNTYGDSNSDTLSSLIRTNDGGFALLGNTVNYSSNDYKALLVKVDNLGNILWNRPYGGSQYFSVFGLSQANDGGYLIGATTQFFDFSVWLIKTDSSGNTQWFRPFQGNRVDSESTQIYGNTAFNTIDGGYFLLSQLSWYQQNISGYASAGLAIKTDSNGDQQWNRTYQNTYTTAIQTLDGGYVLGQTSANSVILSKVDGLGNILWNNSYIDTVDYNTKFVITTEDGGLALVGVSSNQVMLAKLSPDVSAPLVPLPTAVPHSRANATVIQQTLFPGVTATSIIQTIDGGYAAVGQVSNNENEAYSVLLKTDVEGNVEWSRFIHFGNTDTYISVVVQTQDGGYAVAGQKKVNYPLGPSQFCIVKFSSTGQVQWNQTYATTSQQSYGDYLKDFIQTSDGGYALAGTTEYYSGYINALFIVRADNTGNLVWNNTIVSADGTKLGTEVSSLVQTSDNGFSVIGTDDSYGIDVPSFFKIIHLDPNGNVLWARTYGNQNGDSNSYTHDGILTSDGGYLIAGAYSPSSNSPNYALLVKTDSQGNLVWYKIFDNEQLHDAYAVCQTSDGGFVFSSCTDRFACIVKVDASGGIQDTVTLDTIFENVYTTVVPAILGSDATYVIAGHYIGFNNTAYDDIWLAKLNMSQSIPTPTPTQTSSPTPSPTTSITPSSSPKPSPNSSSTPTSSPNPTPTQTPNNSLSEPTPSVPEFTTPIMLVSLGFVAVTLILIIRKKESLTNNKV